MNKILRKIAVSVVVTLASGAIVTVIRGKPAEAATAGAGVGICTCVAMAAKDSMG